MSRKLTNELKKLQLVYDIWTKKGAMTCFFQNTDGKKAIDDIQIGIGDMSKSTGVSSRQLRYWEEKGYIKINQ